MKAIVKPPLKDAAVGHAAVEKGGKREGVAAAMTGRALARGLDRTQREFNE
jgi:hypothetical protein